MTESELNDAVILASRRYVADSGRYPEVVILPEEERALMEEVARKWLHCETTKLPLDGKKFMGLDLVFGDNGRPIQVCTREELELILMEEEERAIEERRRIHEAITKARQASQSQSQEINDHE